MSLVLIVYLIGILPAVTKLFQAFLIISITIGLVGSCFAPVWVDEGYADKVIKTAKKLLWIPLVSVFMVVVIPPQNTLYMMLTVYGAEKIAETPAAQQLGNDAFDVLKGLVAKAKKELSDDASKDVVKEKK